MNFTFFKAENRTFPGEGKHSEATHGEGICPKVCSGQNSYQASLYHKLKANSSHQLIPQGQSGSSFLDN